jgi:hypothetical protein
MRAHPGPMRLSRLEGVVRAARCATAAFRPTQQRAGAPSGAPGLLLRQEAGVSPRAPGRRPFGVSGYRFAGRSNLTHEASVVTSAYRPNETVAGAGVSARAVCGLGTVGATARAAPAAAVSDAARFLVPSPRLGIGMPAQCLGCQPRSSADLDAIVARGRAVAARLGQVALPTRSGPALLRRPAAPLTVADCTTRRRRPARCCRASAASVNGCRACGRSGSGGPRRSSR